MGHELDDLQKMLAVIAQQIAVLEPQNDAQYANALAGLRTKHQELVTRLSHSGVRLRDSTAIGSRTVYVDGNVNDSAITQGIGNRVQMTTFDQRGQRVHSLTNISGDAKGPILSGHFHAPLSTGDNMQAGGVRVGKVEAGKDAVIGTQMRGGDRETILALAELKRESGRERVEVEEVKAKGDAVVGLQYVAQAFDKAQPTNDRLIQGVNALQRLLEGVILVGELTDEDDAFDAKNALSRVQKELAKDSPKGKTVVRHLKNLVEIANEASTVTTGYLGKLASDATALLQLARQQYNL